MDRDLDFSLGSQTNFYGSYAPQTPQYFTPAGLDDNELSGPRGAFLTFFQSKIGLTSYDPSKPQDYNAFLIRLKEYLSSEKLTIAGKQALIAEFERTQVPKRDPVNPSITNPFVSHSPESSQTKAILDKRHAQADEKHKQQMQAFEKRLNLALGAPKSNPWRDTLVGITIVSKAVSEPKKIEKTSNDHTSVISASNDSKPAIQTAGVSAKTPEGRVMAVVSSPVVTSTKIPNATELAEKLAQTMALTSEPISIQSNGDELNEVEKVVKDLLPIDTDHKVPSFAAIHTFPAKGGQFDVVAVGAGATMVIAYEPNKVLESGGSEASKFTTIIANTAITNAVQYKNAQLTEGSIILVLTNDIISNLPRYFVNMRVRDKEGSRGAGYEIDFGELLRNEGYEFELPSNLNENTLMAAFANCAAKEKLRKKSIVEGRKSSGWPQTQEDFDDTKPDNFFIIGMALSNALKTDQRLSPANWTPFAVAALGIGLGLKFFAPEAFLTAAPFLTAIVFTVAAIATLMLIVYVASTIYKDIQNQWKSRSVETPEAELQEKAKKAGKNTNEQGFDKTIKEKALNHAANYRAGIKGRIKDWLFHKHPVQFGIGMFATLVMFTVAGLAAWWILNPVGMDASIAGHVLKGFFDFVADAVFAGGPTFTIGSVANQVIVTLLVALSSVVVLDSIRRLGTYLYETYANTRTPSMNVLMAQDGAEGLKIDSSPVQQKNHNVSPPNRNGEKITLQAGQEYYSRAFVSGKTTVGGPVTIAAALELTVDGDGDPICIDDQWYYDCIDGHGYGKYVKAECFEEGGSTYGSFHSQVPSESFSKTSSYRLKANGWYALANDPNDTYALGAPFTMQILRVQDDNDCIAKVISSEGHPAVGSEILVSKHGIEEVPLAQISSSKQ